ncbi:hypothetical protein GIB67_007148 [Kingdonia uniflora]|uniref:Uncharacterized protein n=1 Tax=Kingdonia uniflora TaxID=39325 RepID=A0A7J7MLG2_9MAGN|nr:hypothetical protein GIB67_007148 [Kingdonia uniflora]
MISLSSRGNRGRLITESRLSNTVALFFLSLKSYQNWITHATLLFNLISPPSS